MYINNTNTPLTCVSCYYTVKNKHDNKYLEWFKNTLSINCPYVFFTSKSNIDLIKSFRNNLPTYFIECEIEDFYTYKFKDKMIIDNYHCPSIELNLIWNEKIFMIQKASIINPFNSNWFQWIDAGICNYRLISPPNISFPNINILQSLPENKFIYSPSIIYNKSLVTKTNYYHHISGSSYILHKKLINNFINIYKIYLENLLNYNNIWTDQLILTHIYKDYQDLFFKFSYNDENAYGQIISILYNDISS